MSYCRPRWISPYTWERIAISIPTAPKAAPVAQDNPQVLVSGTVIGDDCDFRPYFWVRERVSEPGKEAQTGPYTIELRDASGVILGSRSFDTEDPVAYVDRAKGMFREWIPCPAGVATIALVYQGADIASVRSAQTRQRWP